MALRVQLVLSQLRLGDLRQRSHRTIESPWDLLRLLLLRLVARRLLLCRLLRRRLLVRLLVRSLLLW